MAGEVHIGAVEVRPFKSPAQKAKWLSDFVAVDVDALSDQDYGEQCTGYKYFIYGEGKLGKPFGKPHAEGKLFRFLTFGDWRSREGLKLAQSIVRVTLNMLVALREGEIDDLTVETTYQYRVNEGILWKDSENEAALLRATVVDFVMQFSLSDIMQCQNETCRQYFIKASKRGKIFCSQRCASQQAARRWREKSKKKKKGGE